MVKYAPVRPGQLIDEYKNSYLAKLGDIAKDLGLSYKYICEEDEGKKRYFFIIYMDIYEKWVKYYKEISKFYENNRDCRPCGIYAIELDFARQLYIMSKIMHGINDMEVSINLYKHTSFKIPEFVIKSVIVEYNTAAIDETTLEVRKISYDFLFEKLLYLNSLRGKDAEKYSKRMDRERDRAKLMAKLAGAYDAKTDTRGKKILGKKSDSPRNLPLKHLKQYGEIFTIRLNQKAYSNMRTLLESSNIFFSMQDPYVARDDRIVLDFDKKYDIDKLYEEMAEFSFLKKDELLVRKLISTAEFTNKYLAIPEKKACDFKSCVRLLVGVNTFDAFYARCQEVGLKFYYDYDLLSYSAEINDLSSIPIIIDGKNMERMDWIIGDNTNFKYNSTYKPDRLVELDPAFNRKMNNGKFYCSDLFKWSLNFKE